MRWTQFHAAAGTAAEADREGREKYEIAKK
ncbi:hypothetical protein SDC9_05379 [bioreactor metagenome]|uniref:Uncharacterized protein n=1 Tax=bioreactor metagenome TaxID=1076179 RepID=A0A644SYX0_9ZZZZ